MRSFQWFTRGIVGFIMWLLGSMRGSRQCPRSFQWFMGGGFIRRFHGFMMEFQIFLRGFLDFMMGFEVFGLVSMTGLIVNHLSLSLSPGGYQWHHLNPGPANGKAIRGRWLSHGFPRGGAVPGRYRHQRRTRTDLLPGDGDAQRAQQSVPGLSIPRKERKQEQLLSNCQNLNLNSSFSSSSSTSPVHCYAPILPSLPPLAVIHSFIHSFAHQEVHRGFPDAKFTPTHAVVATWENVAAYEDQSPPAGLSNKVRRTQIYE